MDVKGRIERCIGQLRLVQSILCQPSLYSGSGCNAKVIHLNNLNKIYQDIIYFKTTADSRIYYACSVSDVLCIKPDIKNRLFPLIYLSR